YVAQGFEISRIFNAEMLTQFGKLPIKRLIAVYGNRNEPITYWITVGDKATHTSLDQKLQQMRYGLTGKVPDGMLVRVSTIDTDEAAAYQIQTAFIQDMLAAISTKERVRIAGTFSG
ncbi:MAG: EpsI family protein, partial [Gallionellaceae bacterium]|nr:EpsI family protein [Gallionellaceae bacterium]